MHTSKSDAPSSCEDGIRRVSEDPELTAEGLCELGEEYTPRQTQKKHVSDATVMGSQDVWDSDNQGYHTIATRG